MLYFSDIKFTSNLGWKDEILFFKIHQIIMEEGDWGAYFIANLS